MLCFVADHFVVAVAVVLLVFVNIPRTGGEYLCQDLLGIGRGGKVAMR
jgi:hypothetical protein